MRLKNTQKKNTYERYSTLKLKKRDGTIKLNMKLSINTI